MSVHLTIRAATPPDETGLAREQLASWQETRRGCRVMRPDHPGFVTERESFCTIGMADKRFPPQPIAVAGWVGELAGIAQSESPCTLKRREVSG